MEFAGRRIWLCEVAGAPVGSEADAADILGEVFGTGAEMVVIPLQRLAPGFLDLKTGLAGAVLQKFVNYGRQVVVLGDVQPAAEASAALREFVHESNRGRHVWFVRDLDALKVKLAAV
jgi:hypothetical protein